ncbi:MAG: hypothetical protein ACO236_00265 [Candidatus Nanopelagicaceae bacterium]
MTEFEIACQALFSGRINVPKAAALCQLTTDEMMAQFREYAKARQGEDWELDIAMSWPYA